MPNQHFSKSRRVSLLSLLSLAIAPTLARAEEWPSKSLTFVVPFPAGGSNDIAARVVGDGVRRRLGQTVVD